MRSRPHDEVVLERVANWYLNAKDFPMSIDQLRNLVDGIRKPVRFNNIKKRKEIRQLIKFITKPPKAPNEPNINMAE